MFKYRVPLLVLGVVLLFSAAAWKLVLSERWSKRLPDDWEWEVNFLGTGLYPDESGDFPEGREFPEDDDLNVSERIVSIADEDAPAGAVQINDHYISYDINTNAVTWDFTYTAQVDPDTGRHIHEDFRS